MTKKIDYPAIKKAAYELWRTFIPAFLGVLYVQFQAGVDLQNIQAWGMTLLVSATMAGVKAVIKFLRDTYGNGDYTNFIYKLPF